MLLLRQPLARKLLYGSGKIGGIVYNFTRHLRCFRELLRPASTLAITPQYNILRSTDQ
jgi:hypothetical protein